MNSNIGKKRTRHNESIIIRNKRIKKIYIDYDITENNRYIIKEKLDELNEFINNLPLARPL